MGFMFYHRNIDKKSLVNLYRKTINQYKTVCVDSTSSKLREFYGQTISDECILLDKHPHTGFPIYSDKVECLIKKILGGRAYSYVAIVDVKNLKKVNEIEGRTNLIHGDTYLNIVGNAIRNHFRDDTLVFMYGGDEIVLFVNIDKNNASRNPYSIISERLERVNEVIRTSMISYFEYNSIPNDKYQYIDLGIHYDIYSLDEISSPEDLRSKSLIKRSELILSGNLVR